MWKFKVGKRFQITLRKIAPLLDLAAGDWVTMTAVDGKVIIAKQGVK